jgi:ERCC4-type nuclease
MLPIFVDIHEPDLIKTILRTTATVIVQANEPAGLADYWWNNGEIQMWERKQARELLGAIGGNLDTQLLKYKASHPNAGIGIVQEGLITPGKKDKCQLWKKVKSKAKIPKSMYVQGPEVPFSYLAYRAYLYQREMEGIPVVITEDQADTAWTLSAFMYNSMKTKHNGLNRYVVTKVYGKTAKDIYIAQLMGHPDIGRVTATELVDSMKTPWNIYKMPHAVLANLTSERVADSIWKDIGRTK